MAKVLLILDSDTGELVDVAGNARESSGRYGKFARRMLSTSENPRLDYGANGGSSLEISNGGSAGEAITLLARTVNVSGELRIRGSTVEEIAAMAAGGGYRIVTAPYDSAKQAYTISNMAENLITPSGVSSVTLDLPAPLPQDGGGSRPVRDFIVDVDNSGNQSDVTLGCRGRGTGDSFAADEGDDRPQMVKVSGYGSGASGDGGRARLYFSECAMPDAQGNGLFNVARITLSGDIVSIGGQGGS